MVKYIIFIIVFVPPLFIFFCVCCVIMPLVQGNNRVCNDFAIYEPSTVNQSNQIEAVPMGIPVERNIPVIGVPVERNIQIESHTIFIGIPVEAETQTEPNNVQQH